MDESFFLGIFSLFFMFLCCEPYVFLKGNIKNLLKHCFLLQGVWGLCMIVLFL